MKIIGHRGARGTQLENSPASIAAALQLPIDAIEFDIHHTKDNVLVAMHDTTTQRTARENIRISDVTWPELERLELNNHESIPRLETFLNAAGTHEIYIDIKDADTASLLLTLLPQYSHLSVVVVSRLPEELATIQAARPDIPTYLYFLKAEHPVPRPVHMVRLCEQVGTTGIAFDKLIINPLSYYLAKKAGLRMYIYSVKSLWGTRFLHWLYPNADIETARPDLVNHETVAL